MKKKIKTILIILVLSTVSISFLSLNITNATGATPFTPPPDPPNDSVEWGFDIGDNIGWRVEAYNGSDFLMAWDIIFNVSAFPYFKNYSGNGINYYGVQLRGMSFNSSTNSLEEIPLSFDFPYFNHSMVNFTDSDFIGFTYGNPLNSLPVNPFIPINGTSSSMMQWCAQGLVDDYAIFIGNSNISYPDVNTMRFENSIGSGEYVETSYYNNGTLKAASLFYDMGYGLFLFNYTRIFDFNPLDELEWELDIGDVFYTGMNEFEYKYEIVDFVNKTADYALIPMPVQEVRANISYWDNNTKSWIIIVDNYTIGAANEFYPIVLDPNNLEPTFIVPKGTTGEGLAKSYGIMTTIITPSKISFGDDWFKMENATGYLFMKTFPNGLLKYMHSKKFVYPIDYIIAFYKNSTIINGDYDFEIEPYGTDEFFVNVNISVSGDTHLLFAGMDLNPTNNTLDDDLLFLDIFLNETSNLVGLMNITIDYDDAKYIYIKTWWFDMSANGGKGVWVQIPYTTMGTGKIQVSVNHTSFFAMSGKSLPGSFILNDNVIDFDTDGIFDLYWGNSIGATNYSVYESNSPIAVLTGSETLLANETTDLTLPLNGYANGIYYFIVVAHNNHGDTLSNDVQVIVAIPLDPPGSFDLSSNADPLDTDGVFTLTWTTASGASNYSVYEFSGHITSINISLTLLADETTDLTLPLNGYANGIYYFIVVAHNNDGDTLSNDVQVIVAIPLNPPGSFVLSTNADNPDDDGSFTLTWTASARAVNYTVYVHSSYITTINSSLTALVTEITYHSLALMDYVDGTYYFIVVAHNNAGDTLSNCIDVTVDIPSGGGIPGYNLYFLLILFPVITAILIRKRLKKI